MSRKIGAFAREDPSEGFNVDVIKRARMNHAERVIEGTGFFPKEVDVFRYHRFIGAELRFTTPQRHPAPVNYGSGFGNIAQTTTSQPDAAGGSRT